LTVFSGFNNAREIAAWGGQSAGPNQYTFTFYGTPETGLAPVVTGYAVANGITESGVIAGHTMDASNQFHAFTWSAAGGLFLIPTPGASWTSMIEDAAIGVYDPDAMGGYVWKDGVLHAIDAVDSFPQGVSEDGHFVTGTSASGAWRWTEGDGLEPLASLPGDGAVSGTDVDSAGHVFGYGSNRDTPNRPHTVLWDAEGTPVNLSPEAYFAGGGLETCQEGEVRTFCTALYTPTCNYDFRTRIYSWRRESLEMVDMLKKAEEKITALQLEGLISLRRLNNLLTYNLRPAQFKITTGKPYQMRSAATKLQQGLDKLKGWLGDDADHPVASAATWDILEVLESLKDTYLPPSCS
jgi:hypothetical protein